MIAKNGRNYEDLPHFTEGDEGFRSKFLSWDLGNNSFTDVQEYLRVKDTILVPMASFEQHGPHLPVGTDTMVANTLADDAARQARGDCCDGTEVHPAHQRLLTHHGKVARDHADGDRRLQTFSERDHERIHDGLPSQADHG